MKIKTLGILLGVLTIAGSASFAYADSNNNFMTRLNRGELHEMRNNGNKDGFMRETRRLQNNFQNLELTEEQRVELNQIRKSGDPSLVREKLDEWGVAHPELYNYGGGERNGLKLGYIYQQISEEQKEELMDVLKTKDYDAIRAKLEEFGFERPSFEDIENLLSDEDLDKLEEAKELFQNGERKEAVQLMKEVRDDNKDKFIGSGIGRFFGRIGSFFRGLF